MKKIVILCLISFMANAQSVSVEKAVEQLKILMIQPEYKALNDLAHAELTYGHSGGKIENKEQFIDQLVSKRSDFKKIDISEQSIQLARNTAIVRHILEAETFDGGVPGHIKLKILLVWVKEKNTWKLLARQAVKI